MQVTKQQLLEALTKVPDDCVLNVSIEGGDIIEVTEVDVNINRFSPAFCLDFTLKN